MQSYGHGFLLTVLVLSFPFRPALTKLICPYKPVPQTQLNAFDLSSESSHTNGIEEQMKTSCQEFEDVPPSSAAVLDTFELKRDQVKLVRKKRFWSSRENTNINSTSSVSAATNSSGYDDAFDALLTYHDGLIEREGRRVVDMPDMLRKSTEHFLFFSVTTVMTVSDVSLRVPATLERVSSVTAEKLPDGDVYMSCNVSLGNFESWGQYNVKVGGVGPSGNFQTTIRGRVVHTTLRFHELPAVVGGEEKQAPPRCSLNATELTLVERGRNDVPAVLSRWAAEVEDVETSLRVMKELLNERLDQFPCDDSFVALVRRGNATA